MFCACVECVHVHIPNRSMCASTGEYRSVGGQTESMNWPLVSYVIHSQRSKLAQANEDEEFEQEKLTILTLTNGNKPLNRWTLYMEDFH